VIRMRTAGTRRAGAPARVARLSVVTAVLLHGAAFAVWPEYIPNVYRLRDEKLPVIVELPRISIPPPPAPVQPPSVPLEADMDDLVDEEETIAPTDFDPGNVPPIAPPEVGEVEEFLPFDTRPVALYVEVPAYPDLARRADLEGLVIVRVKIDERGRVVRARVVESTADVFEPAALEAAFKCRFKPARQRDIPVPCSIVIPFRFTLRG